MIPRRASIAINRPARVSPTRSRRCNSDTDAVCVCRTTSIAFSSSGSSDGEFDPAEDPLLEKAIDVVLQTQTASVSLLQRRLRVGDTRAGRLIAMLARRGIISGY